MEGVDVCLLEVGRESQETLASEHSEKSARLLARGGIEWKTMPVSERGV